jgi:hypothetical protein
VSAAAKKTALKSTFKNGSPDTLRSSYEDLRTRVLAGGRGPGFALFLHHGMRQWMEVCDSVTSAVATLEPAEVTPDPKYVLPEMRSEIVSILAGLLIQKRGEAKR